MGAIGFVLLLCVPFAFAYPEGAPCSRIESMTPRHGRQRPSTNDPPYRLRLLLRRGQRCYRPGQNIAVRLAGVKGEEFKGFIIQARQICDDKETSERVGSFSEPKNKWDYQCPDDKTSITHEDNDKKTSIRAKWKIDQNAGPIKFVATVVKRYKKIWVREVKSSILKPCGGKQEKSCPDEEKDDGSFSRS